MSPRPFTITFPANADPEIVEEVLSSIARLGALSSGLQTREHFLVVARESELRQFEALAAEWERAGILSVGPLGA